jgi:hypothetical protein
MEYNMFIRAKTKANKKSNKKSISYFITENSWINGSVVQSTVLNLGTNFSLEKSKWGLLVNRITSIIDNQNIIFPCTDEIENLAQSLAAKIRSSQPVKDELTGMKPGSSLAGPEKETKRSQVSGAGVIRK